MEKGITGKKLIFLLMSALFPPTALLIASSGSSLLCPDIREGGLLLYLTECIAVILSGIPAVFLMIKKELSLPETHNVRQSFLYSFRLSAIQENPLLYSLTAVYAILAVSVTLSMPYLFLCCHTFLGAAVSAVIAASAAAAAAVIAVFYRQLFDLVGFKSCALPAVCLLTAGYVILYTCHRTVSSFLGFFLLMSGYLAAVTVLSVMIQDFIPEEKGDKYQAVLLLGQVLLPGIAGPAIGAFLLCGPWRNTGTVQDASALYNWTFLPVTLIFVFLLLVILFLIFRAMRRGCHPLLSETGEAFILQKVLQQQEVNNIWNHYPRPQMRRESFYSLNGIWEVNGQKIRVPFPPQSLLSGYEGRTGAHLEYSRTFVSPLNPSEKSSRLLLHFGAVDQVAEVFLNHRFLGKHEGGYLPFSFDITEFVTAGDNLLTVKVTDTLSPRYPYGKQRKARGGMWYTPVSGIWQSVWMECVPLLYIKNLAINADTEKISLHVTDSGTDIPQNRNGSENASVEPKGKKEVPDDGLSVTITLHDGSQYTVREDHQAAAKQRHDTPHTEGHTIEIDLTSIRLEDGSLYQPVLWTPEHPYLYEMTVTLGSDTVSSYFGLRKIERKLVNGIPRVCLNGAPIFLHGVLDQGYFCDGIYLPAAEEEYEQDILRMKNLGINMLRKHIKIEPECFYHYCDTHGMLVMQDMVNSGVYSWIKDTALPTLGIYQKGDGRLWSRKKRRNFFTQHMEDTIRHLRSHPCVIAYTIFNEGWGQFDSDAMYLRARRLDSSRLYDAASGWFPRSESDFDSQHIYFKALLLPELPKKPVLVSEFGGCSLRIPDHFFAKYAKYGYGDCADEQELTERILRLYEDIILPAIPKGLCGCIYTQLSDVEDETNGLYTYDRRCLKVNPKAMRELADRLMAALDFHEK